MGDPYFDEFCASQIRMVADGATVGRPMRHAGRAQLERIGRSVVLTHSHAGSRPALIFELYPQGGSGDGGARRDS